MSLDARLRELERRTRAGAHVSEEERIAALLRAGAPDPRWHPRPGAQVEVRGRRRMVSVLWPRALTPEPLSARGLQAWTVLAGGRVAGPDEAVWLPPGTLVRALREWEDYGAHRWVRYGLGPRQEYEALVAGEWRPFRSHQLGGHLALQDAPEGVPVWAVETTDGTSRSLAAWRRWARGGRVLRLGRGDDVSTGGGTTPRADEGRPCPP